jgi:AraC-like DNA-binding protein
MRYLARWRLRLARTYLRETSDPLARIAERIGYESEAAFCRAFKRMFGVPPGSVRQSGETAPPP